MAVDNSANIGIRVFLDDAASVGLGGLSNQLNGIGVFARIAGLNFKEMNAQMAAMSGVIGLAAAFAGFAGAIGYSVQQAMEIEQALTKVENATDIAGPAVNQLQTYLLKLGGSSIFSIKELADGMATLGQYSFKTLGQVESLSGAGVDLAEAINTDTVSAFKLLAVTMQAFKIPADKATDVAAMLFYSFEHGTPNVSQLTSALGQLGGAATLLHVPFGDVLAALDVISTNFGNVSVAATGLRYFLLNIAYGTKGAREELAKLGISAYDVNGSFRGLGPIFQDLYDKVKNLNDQDKSKVFGTLFNQRGSAAIKELIQSLEQYRGTVHALTAEEKSHNDLMAAVGRVMDNLSSILKTVVSNFQDFAGEVGLVLLPYIKGFMTHAILPLVTKLRELAGDPAIAQTVAKFLLLGAALSGIALVVIAFLSPAGLFIGIMTGVMLAVGLVAAGVIWLQLHWQAITAAFQRILPILHTVGAALLVVGAVIAGIAVGVFTDAILAAISAAATWAMTLFTTTIPSMIGFVINLVRMIGMILIWAVQQYAIVLPVLWSSTVAWIANAAAAIAAALPYILIAAVIAAAIVGLVLLVQHLGFLNVLLMLGKAAWAAIWPSIQEAGQAIKGAFLEAVKQLQPVWQQLVQAFNQAKPVLLVLGAVLGTLIVVSIGILLGTLRGLINVLVAVITTVIRVVAGIVQVFGGIIQFFMGLFTVLHGIFTGNFTEIQNGWKQMGAGIMNIVQGLWNAVSAVFVGAFNVIKGFVWGFIQGIVGFFTNLANTLVHHSIIPDMMSAILGSITGFIPHILGAFASMVVQLVSHASQLPDKIKQAIGNVGNFLYSAGQSLIQGFINGLSSMIGSLMNAAGNMLNNLRNLFPHSPAKEGPLVDAHLWMPNLVNILSDTTKKSAPSLYSSMSHVAGAAQAGLFSAAANSRPAGSGQGGATYTFNVNGKPFMSFFHNQITGELQSNGVGRLLR